MHPGVKNYFENMEVGLDNLNNQPQGISQEPEKGYDIPEFKSGEQQVEKIIRYNKA
jgi:hypothetical protein